MATRTARQQKATRSRKERLTSKASLVYEIETFRQDMERVAIERQIEVEIDEELAEFTNGFHTDADVVEPKLSVTLQERFAADYWAWVDAVEEEFECEWEVA